MVRTQLKIYECWKIAAYQLLVIYYREIRIKFFSSFLLRNSQCTSMWKRHSREISTLPSALSKMRSVQHSFGQIVLFRKIKTNISVVGIEMASEKLKLKPQKSSNKKFSNFFNNCWWIYVYISNVFSNYTREKTQKSRFKINCEYAIEYSVKVNIKNNKL